MQMKLEDEKESANDKPKLKHDRFGGEKGAESDFCSTFQSIDQKVLAHWSSVPQSWRNEEEQQGPHRPQSNPSKEVRWRGPALHSEDQARNSSSRVGARLGREE